MRESKLGEPEEVDKLIANFMDKVTGLLVFHGAHGVASSAEDPRTKYIHSQLLEQALDLHVTLSKYIELLYVMKKDSGRR